MLSADVPLERMLLAYLLNAPRAAGRLGGLRPEHLVDVDCRRALAAVLALEAEGKRPDEASVLQRMRDSGAADAAKAAQRIKAGGMLGGGVGEAVHHLQQLASIRAVREPLLEALAMVEGNRLDNARARIRELSDSLDASDAEESGSTSYTFKEAALEVFEEVRRRAERPPMEIGPFTPLATYFMPGELIVVGGETNAGKSQLSLMLGQRWHHATGQRCGIVSTEDRAYVYGDRLIATEVNRSLLSGTSTPDAFEDAAIGIERIGQKDAGHLEVLDDHELGSVERSMGRLVRKGCGVVVVDYLQTVTTRDAARNARGDEKVEQIVRRVKAAGKRLRVPVILVSQLSRPERKQHREPSIYELKGSGYIEQAAGAIVLVWKTADDGDSYARIAKLKSSGERPRALMVRNEGGMVVRLEKDHGGRGGVDLSAFGGVKR